MDANIFDASQKYGLRLSHSSNQIGATDDWNSKKYITNLIVSSKTELFNNTKFINNINFQNLGTYFFGDENISTPNKNKDNEINYNKWGFGSRLYSRSNDLKWDAIILGNKLIGLQGLNELTITGKFDLKSTRIKDTGIGFELKNNLTHSLFEYNGFEKKRSLFTSQPRITYAKKLFSLS